MENISDNYLFKPCKEEEYTTCKNYNIKCLKCKRVVGAFSGLLEIFEHYEMKHRKDCYESK